MTKSHQKATAAAVLIRTKYSEKEFDGETDESVWFYARRVHLCRILRTSYTVIRRVDANLRELNGSTRLQRRSAPLEIDR